MTMTTHPFSYGDRVATTVRYGRRKPGAQATITNPAGCGTQGCDCVEVIFDNATGLELFGLNVGVASLNYA